MSNILTYGTFDLLHRGHLNILKSAAKLGNKLFVGVSTDDFNKQKGKVAFESQFERRNALESLSFITAVFWEHDMHQKISDIQRLNIECFVIGDDWLGNFDYLSDYCDVLYYPRTPGISSTILRSQIEAVL